MPRYRNRRSYERKRRNTAWQTFNQTIANYGAASMRLVHLTAIQDFDQLLERQRGYMSATGSNEAMAGVIGSVVLPARIFTGITPGDVIPSNDFPNLLGTGEGAEDDFPLWSPVEVHTISNSGGNVNCHWDSKAKRRIPKAIVTGKHITRG